MFLRDRLDDVASRSDDVASRSDDVASRSDDVASRSSDVRECECRLARPIKRKDRSSIYVPSITRIGPASILPSSVFIVFTGKVVVLYT